MSVERQRTRVLAWAVDVARAPPTPIPVIVTDTDPAWIEITRDLTFFEGRDRFVWTSEKSGWRHAYLYDYDGNEKQLTTGDWEVSSLIALDEAGIETRRPPPLRRIDFAGADAPGDVPTYA